MQRANNFKLSMPNRMCFQTSKEGQCVFLGGLVPWHDLQVADEKPQEAEKRIFVSTGLRVRKGEAQDSMFATKEVRGSEYLDTLV